MILRVHQWFFSLVTYQEIIQHSIKPRQTRSFQFGPGFHNQLGCCWIAFQAFHQERFHVRILVTYNFFFKQFSNVPRFQKKLVIFMIVWRKIQYLKCVNCGTTYASKRQSAARISQGLMGTWACRVISMRSRTKASLCWKIQKSFSSSSLEIPASVYDCSILVVNDKGAFKKKSWNMLPKSILVTLQTLAYGRVTRKGFEYIWFKIFPTGTYKTIHNKEWFN